MKYLKKAPRKDLIMSRGRYRRGAYCEAIRCSFS